MKSNFIFQIDAAKLILKVLDKKGIINIGGPSKTIYNFAKNKAKKYSKGNFQKDGYEPLKFYKIIHENN